MTADTPIPTDPSIDGRSAGGSSGTPQVGRRIGLFGGTFDPVHHGHLAAAWNVRQILDLDEIWLVVANDPWQKSGDRTITSASTRLEWVRQAVRAFDGLEASDVEIESGGASYTVDTIAVLREQHPEVSWSVIVGTDVVADLDTWHRADELREAIEIVQHGSGVGRLLFIVAEVVLLGAIPVLGLLGFRTLLDTRSGEFAIEPGPADAGWVAAVAPSPLSILIDVDDGRVGGAVLLAPSGDDVDGGTVILISGATQVDGRALSERTPAGVVSALEEALRLDLGVPAIADGVHRIESLPLDGGAIDFTAAEALLRDAVPLPRGHEVGARLQVRIVDRSGGNDLEVAARNLGRAGFEVVQIANAVVFDEGVTQVLASPVGGEDEIARLAALADAAPVPPSLDAEAASIVTLLLGPNASIARPTE